MTARKATAPKLLKDPLNFMEDADYTLGVQLGLRRHVWSLNGGKGDHPDQRPCPSWCWVAQHAEYDHPIGSDQPMQAEHSMEARASVALTLYRGSQGGADGERYMESATLEPRIEQVGQDAPILVIGGRFHDDDGKQAYDHEMVKMTVDDTRDLIKVLTHLVEVAERG